MFFPGTLQEGITTALQQAKSVVCFVTDSGDESKQWEEDFLPNSEASSLIESQTVLLRLEAGSQEEGFLTQLYPIPKKPTIVIIKNGELKEYIAAGVTKDEFVRRVKTVLEPTAVPAATPAQQEQAPVPSPTPQTVPRTEASPANSSLGQGVSSPESQIRSAAAEQPARNTDTQPSTNNNRTANTPQQHNSDETATKDPVEPTSPSSKEAQAKQHAELLKKKQREAREERQRILKAIEDDKIARQARKAELEAQRLAAATAAAANGEETTSTSTPGSKPRSSNGRLSEHCAIQVRLLDGSTIRNRFSSTADTVQSIRKWVDEARTDGKTPYNFKILLTPLPSKAILATEESQSLRELKLAPSATLILVPAAGKKYTRPPASYSAASNSASSASASASNSSNAAAAAATIANSDSYPGQEDGDNIFLRFIAFILSIVNGIFGVVVSFFTTLFSTAGPPQPTDQTSSQQASSSGTTTGLAGGGSRIKGLERQRRPENRNDQQFYNGNSTNFEPRPDDKDE